MSDSQPQFIVFNYVTQRAEQIDEAPQYGDPNQQVQSDLMNAYDLSVSGASSLSSSTITGVAPSVLGDPVSAVLTTAQNSINVSSEQLATIQASFSSLVGLGKIQSTISLMQSHAKSVLDKPTHVFEAIDLYFKPEDVGSANRCTSIQDFIGSIQGKYNDALSKVTSGLGEISSALLSVPGAAITAFNAACNAIIAAITSGVKTAIDAATTLINQATQAIFSNLTAAAKAAMSAVNGAITAVSDAIQAEVQNVTAALNKLLNNPFRLSVPNVNPCIKQIFEKSNPLAQEFSVNRVFS